VLGAARERNRITSDEKCHYGSSRLAGVVVTLQACA